MNWTDTLKCITVAGLSTLLYQPAAAQREESISEMMARYRVFCLQQPKEVQADCQRRAKAAVDQEKARRDADRAYAREQARQAKQRY